MASGKAKEKVAGTDQWTKYGSGFIGDMSEEQKENLASFLGKVSQSVIDEIKMPHETNESFAARFLRARKYSVKDAVEMVQNAAKWRRERSDGSPRELAAVEIDDLLGCPVEELRRFYPNAYLPVLDKQWRPVYIERTGCLDIEALMCSTTPKKLLNWHLACQEGFNAKRCAMSTRQRTDGGFTDSTTNVLDLEGFSMSQLNSVTRQYLQDAASVDSNNYPETMGKLLIINAPALFSTAWYIIKGFLDERTQSKIEVVGYDYKDRLFDLLGGKANVPVEYGGELRIPGGVFANHNVVDLTVASGRKETVETKITKGKNYRLRWIARPAELVAGVEFRPASGGAAVTLVAPKNHRECATKVIETTYEAPEDGTVVATFDNSAGWNQRIVHYSAVVLEDFLAHREEMRKQLAKMPWRGPEGEFEADVITEGAHPDAAKKGEAGPAAASGGGKAP